MSVRRACSTLRVDRALYVYKSKRGDQAALKHRIKDICATRVRYGYRRIHVLLQREGWAVNVKRVYRLYRELSLQLRNKTPKRRVKAKLREDRTDAKQINETWAMDFVQTSWPPAANSACSRLSTSSAASRRRSIRGSATGACMSCSSGKAT
ncbi:transposase [Bradyrhizobium sp. 144]|nr:transposase [Bradyrhizobium sp. 144]